MVRTMLDSTEPRAIPPDAQMVAGYVDGLYEWSAAEWAMFPNSVKVTISAIGLRVAQVGDVERGCIWPVANAVPYVRRQRAAGLRGAIYINERNDWGPCRQAFWAAGEPEPDWWVANYDGIAIIPAGAIAKQHRHPHDGDGIADKPWETGFHADESVVADYWPGIDFAEGFLMGLSDNEQREILGLLRNLNNWWQVGIGDAEHASEVGPIDGQTGYAAVSAIYEMRRRLKDVQAQQVADAKTIAELNQKVDAISTGVGYSLDDVATATANKISAQARDGDPTTGPVS